MKYAMCPKCGRRLCKGENGTKVEMECPKCGEFASVIIEEFYLSGFFFDAYYARLRGFYLAVGLFLFGAEICPIAKISSILRKRKNRRISK